MKNQFIKTVSCVLVFVLTALSLTSCGFWFSKKSIFPEGYTGGYGIPYGSGFEIYWVETYEEAVDAMNQLKSHGSTFYKTAIFSYDGDLFDTKYCFQFGHKKDNIKYGDNPYDRWAEEVVVISVAFFEDVTIDELVYSNIGDYTHVTCSRSNDFNQICEIYPNISSLPLEYKYSEYTYSYYNQEKIRREHILSYDGEMIVHFYGLVDSEGNPIPSQEGVEAIVNSIVFIGVDD